MTKYLVAGLLKYSKGDPAFLEARAIQTNITHQCFIFFIYLFFTVLGHQRCMGFSPVVVSEDISLWWLLLWSIGAASVVVAHVLSSSSLQALEHRL